MKLALSLFCCVFLTASARADAVRLQIIGPDKKPVAGAQVRVAEYQGYRGVQDAAARDFVTDENGKVALESKGSLKELPGIEQFTKRNFLVARVAAPGFGVSLQTLKEGDNEIALAPGYTWKGTVFDGAQQPVEGAKVVVSDVTAPDRMTIDQMDMLPQPKALRLETLTDKSGNWSFEGMPLTGIARVGVASPGFKRERVALPLDGNAAPPLFLEPGATIKGRLLTPEGDGAAGVPLFAAGPSDSNPFDNIFETSADGSFEMTGLSEGDYYLQFIGFGTGKTLPFLIQAKTVEGVEAGEVRDIGVWKAIKGVQVKGKVVESGTKKPLSGATVQNTMSTEEGVSDQNGEFSLQTVNEGQIQLYAAGFVTTMVPLKAALNGVIDLGTIELKRGLSATGLVKDRDGRGVGSLTLVASRNEEDSVYARTDPTGKFEFTGMEPGVYSVTILNGKLVNGVKFTVTPGQKPPSIEVVIEGISRSPEPKMAYGQVVDSEGRPVAGAKVLVSADPNSLYMLPDPTISGLDGRFTVAYSQVESEKPKLLSISRPGYTSLQGDEFKLVDGIWQATVVLQQRGLALRGHVLDSQGQPAPGAFVSLAGRNDLSMVQADYQGAFTLPDVPLQNISVLASAGKGYGETRIEKAGEDVRVTLREPTGDPTNPTEAAALADQLLPGASLGRLPAGKWDIYWERLGTQRMEAMAQNSQSVEAWTQYLEGLARRDPKTFLQRTAQPMELAPKGETVDALIATVQAGSHDPIQRAKAQKWLQEHSRPSLQMSEAGAASLLSIARVAETYETGGGTKWVDFAAQIAAQLTDTARLRAAGGLGRSAAEVNTAALANLTQEWGGVAQMHAYMNAVTVFLSKGDLKTAAELIKTMETLLPEAEKSKDMKVLAPYAQKPADLLQNARTWYALKLVKTDPAAAYEMVPLLSDYKRAELLLEVGRGLAQKGQTETAGQALRAAFQTEYSNIEWLAQAAEVALEFDPKLADELFRMVWARTKPKAQEIGYRNSLAPYAEARAKKWPGESRILIEREWAQQLPAFKGEKDFDAYQDALNLKALVTAMAAISPQRAIEMAGQLPNYQNLPREARASIMLKLLGGE